MLLVAAGGEIMHKVKGDDAGSRISSSHEEPEVIVSIAYRYLIPGAIFCFSDVESCQDGCDS